MKIITDILVFITILVVGTPLKIFVKLVELARREDYNSWVMFFFKLFLVRFILEFVTCIIKDRELNFEFWSCLTIFGIAYVTYQVQRKLNAIAIVFNKKTYYPFQVYDRFGEQTLFGVFFVPIVVVLYTYNLVMFMTDNPINFLG
jgi:hypothetical protein